jgi:biotin carboxyl carrier protein
LLYFISSHLNSFAVNNQDYLLMQARQQEIAKLAAEARKTAFEAAQKKAAEKDAKSREAVTTKPSQNSENSVTGPATVNMNEVKSELQGTSFFYRSSSVHL